jgi:lipoyl(octanoyl) transferase
VQDLKKTIESKFISEPSAQLTSRYLGSVEYALAEKHQYELHDICVRQGQESIIGLEHPTVITLGYRAEPSMELARESELIPVLKVHRGGLATLHSEGQLVIYPIIQLKKYHLGVKDYVQLLLGCTQQLLSDFGVTARLDTEAVGLYTKKGKIAFCGIQVKNGTTLHGLSLNVTNDLSLFSTIRSCGVTNPVFDRLFDHGVQVSLETLFHRWSRIFIERLQTRLSSAGVRPQPK